MSPVKRKSITSERDYLPFQPSTISKVRLPTKSIINSIDFDNETNYKISSFLTKIGVDELKFTEIRIGSKFKDFKLESLNSP